MEHELHRGLCQRRAYCRPPILAAGVRQLGLELWVFWISPSDHPLAWWTGEELLMGCVLWDDLCLELPKAGI